MIVDLDSWETGYADGQLARRRNARSSLIRHRTRWVSAKVAPPARECARTRRGCVILCYRLRFASDGRAEARRKTTSPEYSKFPFKRRPARLPRSKLASVAFRVSIGSRRRSLPSSSSRSKAFFSRAEG